MPTPEVHSVSENMVAAICAEIEDGDVLLEGIGTFLPTSAYMLAQATHAPRSIRLCPVGNCFVPDSHSLSLAAYEFEALERAVYRFTYWDVNGSYLPSFITGRRGGWKEFLRPAQVDATGRTNNVVIGPYEAPKVRLPGAAGLPDGIPIEAALYMYVPRHDRNCFVRKLDFVSGAGSEEGARPHTIVTDLAIMRFRPGGMLEVVTLMPGVTREQVQDQTGFDLAFREQLVPLRPLTAEQLDILRTRVDPLALRDLEVFTGEDRLNRIEQLARREPARQVLHARLAAIAARAGQTTGA
jgi:acyl CoA:acetate/3-ketoacid CoA transferase beta subunit